MAGTTLSRHGFIGQPESTLRDLVIHHNLLVAEVDALRQQMGYMMPGVLTSDPANKAGTTDAAEWRTEAFTFLFRGATVSAVAAETALTATTHDVAASKEAWYVISVQSNGTSFTITKGADQTIGTVVLPTTPDNEVVVGYMGIVSGTSGFDATTDDIAVAGTIISTLTFVDPASMAAADFTAAKIGDAEGDVITE